MIQQGIAMVMQKGNGEEIIFAASWANHNIENANERKMQK